MIMMSELHLGFEGHDMREGAAARQAGCRMLQWCLPCTQSWMQVGDLQTEAGSMSLALRTVKVPIDEAVCNAARGAQVHT